MKFINIALEKIIRKDKEQFIFGIFKIICSVMCAIITQNLLLTIIYIIVTSFFDLLTENFKVFSLDKFIDWIYKQKNYLYIVLIAIAFSPTIAWGFSSKTITFSSISLLSIKKCLVERLYNLVPNIFGALIVCSFISYLSKLGADKVLCATIHLKKQFFDVIMRGGFMIAFLNAINYAVKDKDYISEILNTIHLTNIVFLGVVILGAYALWIIDKDSSNLGDTNVYPLFSLVLCVAFLWSCAFFPVKLKNAPIEWLLLFLNGISSIIVAWVFWAFIKRKMNNVIKNPPYLQLCLFTLFVSLIIIYGIKNMGVNEKNSMITQLISGTTVLLGVIVLLYIVDDLQKKSLVTQRKQLRLSRLEKELLSKQKEFKSSIENDLDIDNYESNAINDLMTMVKLKTQIKTINNYLEEEFQEMRQEK